jgi:hypothetical protein
MGEWDYRTRIIPLISGRFHRGGIIHPGGALTHNNPLENPEKIHGGVGLSH